MLKIVQITPANGFRAVFEVVDEEHYNHHPVKDIFAEVEKNLRVVPLVCFALVDCPLPNGGKAIRQVVGMIIDPTFGDMDFCERADGAPIHVGHLLGYLPPEGGKELMDNFRWITAARIDSRYVDEDAWKLALGERSK
jgi:hypothetical protein